MDPELLAPDQFWREESCSTIFPGYYIRRMYALGTVRCKVLGGHVPSDQPKDSVVMQRIIEGPHTPRRPKKRKGCRPRIVMGEGRALLDASVRQPPER